MLKRCLPPAETPKRRYRVQERCEISTGASPPLAEDDAVIVTCKNCETSFHLDEDRVPATGVRVRCSRCEEAFFLPSPTADASASNSAVSAATTQDLIAPVGHHASSSGSSEGPGDEESDWEFNVEPPTATTFQTETGEDVDFGRDAHPLESDSRLEADEITDPNALSAGLSAETIFGSVDDYSSLMAEDDASEPEEASVVGVVDSAATLPATSDRGLSVGCYAQVGAASPMAPSQSDDDSKGVKAEPPEARAFLGQLPLASRSPQDGPPLSSDFAFAGDSPCLQETRPTDGVNATTDSSIQVEIPSAWIWMGRTIGWACTVILALVMLIAGLWPTRGVSEQPLTQVTAGPFTIQNVRMTWLETARGESLLRFRGRVSRTYAGDPSSLGALTILLTDPAGRPVSARTPSLGLPLDETVLRESEPDDLRRALAGSAGLLAARSLSGSDFIEVEAILQNVPVDAAQANWYWKPRSGPEASSRVRVRTSDSAERFLSPEIRKGLSPLGLLSAEWAAAS